MFKFLFACTLFLNLLRAEEGSVQVRVHAQLGNNLFQIATASALAWDHGVTAYFPDLLTNPWDNIPINREHVFMRCSMHAPSEPDQVWSEPDFAYHPIPYEGGHLYLKGYFQSEKYFKHQRARLLELFAPREDHYAYMQKKYRWLIDHPCTVGVQVRAQHEDPSGRFFIQYGKDYFGKAMAYFPDDALYIISTNDEAYARRLLPEKMKNCVFLRDEPYYIDLHLLTYCTHSLISNSSFGWWAAWLNQNPEKIVVSPSLWVHPGSGLPTQDLLPEEWIKLDAVWGGYGDPESL
ncbi:MAG: alpha-1,2-fucosyltransferase [Verrucomicrobia bacterium]|nr:alpha-1,2-fucosyltransferase [Verrucomicrobiota bacterium]